MRLRFGVIGIIKRKRPWIYTIFGATNAFSKGFDTRDTDDFGWFDYRLDIPVFETKTLSIGKQKEPQSMERTMSMIAIPFQERTAAADALMASRNVGIVLSGTEFDGRMSWAGGLFNDWLDTGGSRSDSSNQFIGRLTGLPMITQDESNLLHLGIGIRLSDAKEGFATATEPEVNMSPAFLDTGEFRTADGIDTFNYELSWRKGPMWISSEYTSTKIDGAPNGDYQFSGHHIAASWILTGEMRDYNHKSGSLGSIPIAKPTSQGGWGAWEFGIRYSHTDLSDKDIFGGEMDVYSLALNWWLRKDFNINVNWRYIELDKPAEVGSPVLQGQSSAIVSRIVLILD
jgi:phosphate-selective porin OprO/OprP